MVLAKFIIGNSSVVIGEDKLGIKPNRFVEVPDGPLMLTKVVVGSAPVDICVGELSIQANGLVILENSLLQETRFLKIDASVVINRRLSRCETR